MATTVFSDDYTFFGDSVLVSVEAAGDGMFAVRCGDPATTPAIRANRHFAVLHRQLSERLAVRRDRTTHQALSQEPCVSVALTSVGYVSQTTFPHLL